MEYVEPPHPLVTRDDISGYVVSAMSHTQSVPGRIGEEIDGGLIGLPGYSFKITGGSDTSGIPMRFDVHGPVKRKILLSKGPCYTPKKKGMKKRKVVRGNEITDDMKQINMLVLKYGRTKLFEKSKDEES